MKITAPKFCKRKHLCAYTLLIINTCACAYLVATRSALVQRACIYRGWCAYNMTEIEGGKKNKSSVEFTNQRGINIFVPIIIYIIYTMQYSHPDTRSKTAH